MSRGTRHLVARLGKRAVAEARARIDAENAEALEVARREIRLWLFGLPDGVSTPQSLKLLASLGWVIGLGAEVALAIEPASGRARRLHGALRTLQGMCLSGYVWRQCWAEPLDAACIESYQLIEHHHAIARAMKPGADYLAGRIQQRTLSAADVAGAEIYAEGTAT